MALVFGLVGGIGAGKSRVSEALARRGAVVVAGDPVGHEALRQPDIRDAVTAAFGTGVVGPDGAIDRRSLGRLVFSHAAARQTLEAIVFPWIGARLREQLEAARSRPGSWLVVLDAAVMLEAGWNDPCDRIVYIHAPRPTRLDRVRRQRNWSEAELIAREKAQWSLTAKATVADDAIDNAGSLADLEGHLDRLLARRGLLPHGTPRDGT